MALQGHSEDLGVLHHLLTWMPYFFEIVQQESDRGFFEGLARLSHASLMGLQETLHLEVVLPRFYR